MILPANAGLVVEGQVAEFKCPLLQETFLEPGGQGGLNASLLGFPTHCRLLSLVLIANFWV